MHNATSPKMEFFFLRHYDSAQVRFISAFIHPTVKWFSFEYAIYIHKIGTWERKYENNAVLID